MDEPVLQNSLQELLRDLRQLPFLPLDISVPIDQMRMECESIKQAGYELSQYLTNYKLVRKYYANSWSGICLISSDGGLYTDLSEGDIQSSMTDFAETELKSYCPNTYDLIKRLNHDARSTRARLMAIAPKRSLLWHSHVFEHGQPEYILTVQVPIHVPESFLYCVVDKNDFRWYKRFMSHRHFKSVHTSNLKPGSAYVFNSYHYHNVFNLDALKPRLTLMVYLDVRNTGIRNMIRRSIDKFDVDSIVNLAGKTNLGSPLSCY